MESGSEGIDRVSVAAGDRGFVAPELLGTLRHRAALEVEDPDDGHVTAVESVEGELERRLQFAVLNRFSRGFIGSFGGIGVGELKDRGEPADCQTDRLCGLIGIGVVREGVAFEDVVCGGFATGLLPGVGTPFVKASHLIEDRTSDAVVREGRECRAESRIKLTSGLDKTDLACGNEFVV